MTTQSPTFAGITRVDLSFTAVGPAGWQIVGKSDRLRLVDDGVSLTFSAPLSALSTGMGFRDRHMHDYLETKTYPDATLTVDRKTLQLPQPAASIDSAAQGQLTLHGATKQVSFRYQARAVGTDIEVDATMTVNITDHGIRVPSYMGMRVDPKVEVTLHFRTLAT